ncbi:MAG TPA: translation initiation factor IF-3 [Candidatus Yonathbacteria bacterium]|nr:translation initiation factor IF-3 [Candidatus Yonathbacteria bacterium]
MKYNCEAKPIECKGFNTLKTLRKERIRINNQIRARELRVIGEEGENIGILSLEDALAKAEEKTLDLIEISPAAKPPIAKIMDYGKFQYQEKKKQKEVKAKAHTTETKNIQVKIGTSEHDLGLKAKRISAWIKEGHRIKLDLYLVGRAKYTDMNFKKERLERILNLISEEYKVAEEPKRSPKGVSMILEPEKKK